MWSLPTEMTPTRAKAGHGEHWEGTRVLRNTPIALAFGKLTPKVREAIKAMLFPKILKKPKNDRCKFHNRQNCQFPTCKPPK
jgi:hypothetical protein